MTAEKNYSVMWEIELDASSPREAAIMALQIQRDTQSLATCFSVLKTDTGKYTFVDLQKEAVP